MSRALCAACAAVLLLGGARAITDLDVFNFALNVECVEAAFFTWAAYGVPLTPSLLGGGAAGSSLGGTQRGRQKSALRPVARAYRT